MDGLNNMFYAETSDPSVTACFEGDGLRGFVNLSSVAHLAILRPWSVGIIIVQSAIQEMNFIACILSGFAHIGERICEKGPFSSKAIEEVGVYAHAAGCDQAKVYYYLGFWFTFCAQFTLCLGSLRGNCFRNNNICLSFFREHALQIKSKREKDTVDPRMLSLSAKEEKQTNTLNLTDLIQKKSYYFSSIIFLHITKYIIAYETYLEIMHVRLTRNIYIDAGLYCFHEDKN
ncbi:hypothetical protein ACJX0J_022269 [Zea mays]